MYIKRIFFFKEYPFLMFIMNDIDIQYCYNRKVKIEQEGLVQMNIAAYCRVSTDKADQLNSLETQKEFFFEYTKQKANYGNHTIVCFSITVLYLIPFILQPILLFTDLNNLFIQ